MMRPLRRRYALRPQARWLGEGAVELVFGNAIDVATNARAQRAAAVLRAAALPGVVDVVPAYVTVTVVLDADTRVDREAFATDLLARVAADAAVEPGPTRLVRLPTCYDGADLAAVAAHAGIGVDEVIARHSGAEYQVAMLGFLPGFPYLIGLDPTIAMPRLDTPRAEVPAGAVGIGGWQTGIYPVASPGGWRLIGRVAASLFDPRAEPPTLLQPGDRLRFVPVAARELARAPVEIGA
jgi:KipI family sensor histidine kinase inhibitor